MNNLRWCLIVDDDEVGRFSDLEYAKDYIRAAIKGSPDIIVILDLNLPTRSKEIYKFLLGHELQNGD